MGKRLSPHIWDQIKRQWEAGETSSRAELARLYDISTTTLTKHAKNGGWLEFGALAVPPSPAEDTPEVDVQAIATEAATEAATLAALEAEQRHAEELAEKNARIEELEAKLVEASAAAAGVRAVPDFGSVDELLDAAFGDDPDPELAETLQNAALRELGLINKKRMETGLLPLDFTQDPSLIKVEVDKLAADLVAKKTKFRRGDVRLRVLKMVRLDGIVVQVPVERQINNEAAQNGAALWKAREKGMLLADPHRCQRLDCWRVAEMDSEGRLTLDGYCSIDCRSTDPYINQRIIEGVSTSGQQERRSVLLGGTVSI